MYNKFNKFIFIAISTFIITNTSIAIENKITPRETVEKTISKIKELVTTKENSLTKEEVREEIKKIIFPVFNFEEMAKRSLGKNWKSATKKEQEEFIDLFSTLLSKNYTDTIIDGVKNYKVKVTKEKIKGKKAIIRTIITKDDDAIIDYRLRLEENSWKVYDVIIENIGLVSNYRNEFAGIIRDKKLCGLIKDLKKKLNH